MTTVHQGYSGVVEREAAQRLLTEDQLIDQRIMSALVIGDPAALERLYDRYSTVALTVIARIVRDRRIAEDLLQEVFLRIWQHARTYNDDRGNVRGWILGIAHNLALNELRSQRRRPNVVEPPAEFGNGDRPEADALAGVPDPDPPPDEIVWLRERRRRLAGAVRQLPPVQRSVIELYASGYSQSEIARRLEQPLGTVKTRMRRGLLHLRGIVEEQGLQDDR